MKSIVHKLWIGTTLLVIVILGVVWLFQTVFLDKLYTNEQINKLIDESNKIAQALEKININKIENSETENNISYFSNKYSSKIDIFDTQQKILLSTGNQSGRGMGMGIIHVDLKSIIAGQTIIAQGMHPRFGTPIVIIGMPIKNNGVIIGALVINTPLAPIKEAVKVLQSQLSVITIICLVIATLLAFFLSIKIVKPIVDINKAAKRISRGDYTVKLEIKSKDETGKLSVTINELVEQLSKIESLRREFIANVSHEFKTPLGIIRGYTELIEDNLSKEELEKNKNSIEIIHDETSRLDKIVMDMLTLSQMEAGFTKYDISEFDINEIIYEVVGKLSIIASKQQVLIESVEKYSVAIVKGDRDKIKQVLINLINNAIQHSNSSQNIEVNTQKVDDRIKVTIKDFGEGIAKEDLPYVWDRFYKADKSRKREEAGTGLGMAIVENIFKMHNTEYGIDSEVGKGTTVWFML